MDEGQVHVNLLPGDGVRKDLSSRHVPFGLRAASDLMPFTENRQD